MRSETERALTLTPLAEILGAVAQSCPFSWAADALRSPDPEGTIYGYYSIDVDGEATVCLVGEVVRPRVKTRPRRRALWYAWVSDGGLLRGALKETESWPADERWVGEWSQVR